MDGYHNILIYKNAAIFTIWSNSNEILIT